MSIGYQYVTLRCVPDPVREEFVNVGVVLFAQATDYLCADHHVDPARLQALAPGLALDDVHRGLETIARVCAGESPPGVPQMQRQGQRFGWLSAPRSTVLRPGPVHGGLTEDPAAELQRLVRLLVGSA